MNYIVLDLQYLNAQSVSPGRNVITALVGLAVTLDKRIAFRYFKAMPLVGPAKGQ